ncbi:hypothetical protein O6H91_16G016200 [Diphasiastrum complanatum]|uniref:Uncharacterized protein n=1 Tax=Diphasiastrum complanatum TaxID=34168 RepID=A0ACC2BA41_DIPCM|nr:hypothetical protein O6H91_16G016200 [Diphasiastrum complanatum]
MTEFLRSVNEDARIEIDRVLESWNERPVPPIYEHLYRIMLTRWCQNAGALNCLYMGFVLSGFGTYFTRSIFWTCWGIIVSEAFLRYTFRPFINGLTIEASRARARKEKRDLEGAGGQEQDKLEFLELHDSLKPTIGLPVLRFLSFNFLVIPLRALQYMLIFLFIQLLSQPAYFGHVIRSDQRKQGSLCCARATESLYSVAAMFIFLEVLPNGHFDGIVLFLLLALLLCNCYLLEIWHMTFLGIRA